jgi:hypothetical protein
VVLAFIALAGMQYEVARRLDWPMLIGDRAEAIFDMWSLQHFGSGILFGALVMRIGLPHFAARKDMAAAAILFAFGWEGMELAMEAGYFGQAVASWKGGFEHWGNRLVGDPLMVTIGALTASRFASAWKVTLVPAAIWLSVNVASPNSMYIQRLLFG